MKKIDSEPPKINYFSVSYPENHWALNLPKESSKFFIARCIYNESEYLSYLNPTDARGYRSILCLYNKDIKTTFNRKYTHKERKNLLSLAAVIASAYEKIGLVPQIELLGNNSQSMDEFHSLTLGNIDEPSFLHCHIIGRGDPSFCYIADQKLDGPNFGKIFIEEGSKKQIWGEQAQKVAETLRGKIEEVIAEENELVKFF